MDPAPAPFMWHPWHRLSLQDLYKSTTLSYHVQWQCTNGRKRMADSMGLLLGLPQQRPVTTFEVQGTLPEKDIRLVQVGHYAERHRIFTQKDVDDFSCLVGDANFLHQCMDDDDGQEGVRMVHPLLTDPSRPLVHGMLTSTLFSSIFAHRLPGAVYLSQSLQFVRPVYVNDAVVGRLTVQTVTRRRCRGHSSIVMVCDTVLFRQENTNEVCVRGQAKVLVPCLDAPPPQLSE